MSKVTIDADVWAVWDKAAHELMRLWRGRKFQDGRAAYAAAKVSELLSEGLHVMTVDEPRPVGMPTLRVEASIIDVGEEESAPVGLVEESPAEYANAPEPVEARKRVASAARKRKAMKKKGG